MDLSTTYMGFKLANPLIVGSSPLTDDVSVARQLEDAGAGALVMCSLFEEQIRREQLGTLKDIERTEGASAEALSFFPSAHDYRLGPDEYLEQVRRVKAAVKIPVIASLNGVSFSGWLDYAQQIKQAGADALELNVYYLATDPEEDGDDVEARTLGIVRTVRQSTQGLPLAVKLSPFYSSVANLAKRLDDLNVKGLVLFNRFYQPDIDLDNLEVTPSLRLSDSSELLLRLRWLAILAGRTKASLCLSGGVHTPQDVLKGVMAGADAVQTVSAILRRGPEVIRELRQGVTQWLEEHDYESLEQAKGSLSLEKCPDRSAFERANYQRVLNSWR